MPHTTILVKWTELTSLLKSDLFWKNNPLQLFNWGSKLWLSCCEARALIVLCCGREPFVLAFMQLGITREHQPALCHWWHLSVTECTICLLEKKIINLRHSPRATWCYNNVTHGKCVEEDGRLLLRETVEHMSLGGILKTAKLQNKQKQRDV